MNENIKKLVVKSNSLVESKYKLTTREQKIILYLISQIKKEDEEFKTYTLPIKKFSEMLGLKGAPKYSEMKKITKNLIGKVMEIKLDKKVHQVSWLSYVVYNEEEGTVDLRFDPFLKPFLLQLRKEFTTYHLQNIISLRGSYSIRLYELLKQYETIKERIFELEELKGLLGVDDMYPAYGNFKQRVLIPAKEEIAQKTDLLFDFEELKNGRSVQRIKFKIDSQTSNVVKNKQLALFEEEIPIIEYPLYSSINDSASKHGYFVEEKIVLRWEQLAKKKWKQDSENKLLYLIDEVNHNTEVDNPIGYITAVLKSKDDSTNFVAKKRLTKEEKRRQLILGGGDNTVSNEENPTDVPEEREKRKAKLLSMLEK
jgi:plasmid replication initiation protein